MDQTSFDRLARLLGEASDRRAGLKTALAAVLGGPAAVATLEAGAEEKRRDRDRNAGGGGTGRADGSGPDAGKRKRKKTCKPACTGGFTCEKVGKKRACVCGTGVTCGDACCALGQRCVDGQCRAAACDPACADGFVCEGTVCICPSGIECGEACCASGQTCLDGTCAGTPEPDRCIAPGEPCKQVGRPCCAGRVCASGQGGEPDVACYAPKTGACASTAECVYGTVCTDGRCTPPPPPPPTPVGQLGAACNPATNVCTSPGTSCQAYTGDHPVGLDGTYCTLPLQAVCTGDPDCSCYRCEYAAEAVPGAVATGRRGRATAATTCCHGVGESCGSSRDCCEGTACEGGACVAAACTVCKTGDCAYRTIAAAIAGGETDIRIAGGTYDEYNLPLPSAASLTLRPCSASPVTIDATRLGRIMVPITANKTITVMGIAIVHGKPASGDGGAFLVNATTAKLVLDGVAISDSMAANGGAVAIVGGEVVATASTFTRCTASGAGGAFSVTFSGAANGKLGLDGVTISDSTAPTGGGIDSNKGQVVVRNSTITRCTATLVDDGGGGIASYGTGATLKVTDSEISHNTATGASGDGGGISAYGLSVELRGVHLHHNSALVDDTGGGGALLATTTSILENCRITDNAAYWGGGLYLYQSSATTVQITGGTISDNTAQPGPNYGGAGGGIHSWATSLTLTDVRVSGNTAKRKDVGNAGLGGGIYVNKGTTVLAGSTRVETNAAEGDGGGLYVDNVGAATLSGIARVSDNTATGDGAGIFAASGRTITCSATTAVVCGNPNTTPSTATVTTNCGGPGTYSNAGSSTCSAVCRGDATVGSGAC